jgi:bacterioferritin (cytochrome b1)
LVSSFVKFLANSGAHTWFSKIIVFGELAVALGLILGAFTGLAAFFGGLMNWSFIMAGSASTNGLLFAIATWLVLAWRNAGWIGLDRWLLPAVGAPWKAGRLFNESETVTHDLRCAWALDVLEYSKKGEAMEENREMALFNTKANNSAWPDISPVERLLEDFEAHEAKAEKSIEGYKKLLVELTNPVTRFLLQLIIADEEKHRDVLSAMIATLKGSLTWARPAKSLEGAVDLAITDSRLRSSAEGFIELEKEGIKERKALIKDSSGYYHGVFNILLESMIGDSEKHIELLEFLKENLKEA